MIASRVAKAAHGPGHFPMRVPPEMASWWETFGKGQAAGTGQNAGALIAVARDAPFVVRR